MLVGEEEQFLLCCRLQPNPLSDVGFFSSGDRQTGDF